MNDYLIFWTRYSYSTTSPQYVIEVKAEGVSTALDIFLEDHPNTFPTHIALLPQTDEATTIVKLIPAFQLERSLV